MFEWKVEEMKLLNEIGKPSIGIETIFNCELETSREDKISFVDIMTDGRLSYMLKLINKFNNDVKDLSKDKFGHVKTVTLKAWAKRNDIKCMVDKDFSYGRFCILSCCRNIKYDPLNKKGAYDTYGDLIDEVFHRALKQCLQEEYYYFLEHDEYSVLKKKFREYRNRYSTTFGVYVVSSGGEIYIRDEDNRDYRREITIEELKYLILRYEELDNFINKIEEETNITV